jgi:hypothetical protein
MKKSMERDFNFFVSNHEDFVKKYNGKYVVIKNKKVLGAYDDMMEAVNKTMTQEKLGTFIVQMVAPGPESYTIKMYPRISHL